MRVRNLKTLIGRNIGARAKTIRTAASGLTVLASGLTFVGHMPSLWRAMHGLIVSTLVVVVVAFAPTIADAASLIRDYQLTGSFTDALGGPALVSGGGVLGANGYLFNPGQGLSVSGWDPTNLGEDYSIEFYARFDVFGNGSYGKLIDYKDRGSDDGFYVRNVSGGQRPIFFPVNQNSPGPDSMTAGQFHHVVIARDEPGGTDDVVVWLDGVQQWTFDDGSNEYAVANAASNILHFFVDDTATGGENPAGYVDFIRIYDDAVDQSEVDTMVASLPQYGAAEVVVNKTTGLITINGNNNPEPLEMRGYQLTSAAGELSLAGWTSWDSLGLDGDTWSEANPSANQLAELNLTSTGLISANGSRSLGNAYGGGDSGAEDLIFAYLAPGSAQSITIPVTYDTNATFLLGDLDEDEDIDGDDWNLFTDGLGKDLTGLPSSQWLTMGDLTLDGFVNHDDFTAFKQAYEAFNPGSSFAEMVAGVPEPTTLSLATVLLMGLAFPPRRCG